MIGSMIITGSILYIGVRTYNHRDTTKEQPRFQVKSIWRNLREQIFHVEQTETEKDIIVREPEIEHQKELERNLTLAGTAGALTTVGMLIFPPLRFASIPVLIYMGVPSAQATYDNLIVDRHIGRPVVETGLLAIVLVQGIYLTGSIGFISYYLARLLKTEMPDKNGIIFPQITIWRNGTEMKLPANDIQEKDVFQVSTGEKVYVDGIVIDGIALVDQQWATGEKSSATKKVGSRILMSTVISVGTLWVECCNN